MNRFLRRYSLGIAFLLSLVFGQSMLAQASSPADHDSGILIKNGEKVAFFGDSLTALGADNPDGYVFLVQEGLALNGVHIEAIPAGVGGNTSGQLLARMDADVLAKNPDWMLLYCGINDAVPKSRGGTSDLETFQKSMSAIVEKAEAQGIKVIILTNDWEVGNTPYPAGFNEFVRQLAREKKCLLVDIYAAHQALLKAQPTPPERLMNDKDGIHMNPYGNALLATEILKAAGLNEAQLKAAQAAWIDKLDGARVLLVVKVPWLYATMTRRERDKLDLLAKAANKSRAEYVEPIYTRCFIQAARNDTGNPPEPMSIAHAARELFNKELKALLETSTAVPGPVATAP